MRIVIHGMDAVGGTLAAALARAGSEAIGIARGSMLDTVRDAGLKLRAPNIDETVALPVVGHPADIDWRGDEFVLLCMKSHETLPALEALRDAGVKDQAVFCMQNGLENERAALRFFPNVHGVTVMIPAHFLEPGEVAVFCEPKLGLLDIGRFPAGVDDADRALAHRLEVAGFACFLKEDVMTSKRGKLLLNLHNVLAAAVGRGPDADRIARLAREEAETVYASAEFEWEAVNDEDPRRGALIRQVDALPGVARIGGSTSQSIARGAARIETDYLNGEISLLGRLHGVPTPVNDALARIGARLARDGGGVGSRAVAEIEAEIAAR